MAALDNKYIPMLDSVTYTLDLRPKSVDPSGRIRTAEEIKKGTKQLVHTVYIDQTGNVYIIPLKFENGQWVDAYSPRDIVNAAMGDKESVDKLNECSQQLKEYFGKDIMSDSFMQRVYQQDQGLIIDSINRRRQEEGEEPIDIRLPKSPKTATNFTPAELRTVIDSALPIQSNGQVPPEG